MLRNMLADLGHRVANIGVRVEQVMMLLRFPVGEGRELLRDRLEQANNDPNWGRLHIMAELLHSDSVLETLVWRYTIQGLNLQEPGNDSQTASLPTLPVERKPE